MIKNQARVLVLGGGGREHALAWKLSRSPRVAQIVVAPGNPGFDPEWERFPINLGGGQPEFDRLTQYCLRTHVDLVVVGPDNPLAEGVCDLLREAGVACFGPSRAAARIEASKAFAKDIMKSAGVPTAPYQVFSSSEEAKRWLKAAPWDAHGWVIKADGLAFGKGVQVCLTIEEALRAVDQLFTISGKLVVEEELKGEEISWLALSDGKTHSLLEPARDYKRLKDGNQGPNTGGMGAFSPVSGIPDAWYERVSREVFAPVLAEMSRRGSPFAGVLYAGLMVNVKLDKIWVIEFNSRFGDPETQVLLPRLSGDFYEWCAGVAAGDISSLPRRVPFSAQRAVTVVAAAPGYPDRPMHGMPLEGPAVAMVSQEVCPDYFFAGVSGSGERLQVAGGRVFSANGLGETLESARREAYHRLEKIWYEGMQARRDVGEGVQ